MIPQSMEKDKQKDNREKEKKSYPKYTSLQKKKQENHKEKIKGNNLLLKECLQRTMSNCEHC